MIIIIDNQNCNNIGEIIEEGLKNSVVKCICMQGNNQSFEDLQKAQNEFSRFISFCILFRDLKGIQDYMLIGNKEDQVKFLIYKIAEELEIPIEDIKQRKEEIISYAYMNFKKHGYVFHAANSASVQLNMTIGLNDNNVDYKQQKELLYIESIYRKYEPYCQYSPLGHGATDITEEKTGWFFDGSPIHSTIYANSPQWFSYLCGKSYVYFDNIPENLRNGYANRDYFTSLKAVTWLVKDKNMLLEDRKKILYFFMKCWNEYKDTTPCLMFIPVEEVGINENINLEQYLSLEGTINLFEDIIEGKVNPVKNYCCKKKITPDKLSYVDLSPILPRFKARKKEIKQTEER